MKIVFIILVLGYLAGSVVGWYYGVYIELNSLDETFKRLIVPNLVFTILFTAILVYIAKRAVPDYIKRGKKIWHWVRVVVFAGASFYLNQGYVRLINSHIGEQQRVYIEGRIVKREVKQRPRIRKKRARYYISVRDSATGKYYRFKLKKGAYESFEGLSHFEKEFNIGSLGIIYRTEL